jgi:hypothetical protein
VRDALRRLEQDFADIQDVEFTIENGKLWMLQTRAAKRTLNRSCGSGGTADGQALHRRLHRVVDRHLRARGLKPAPRNGQSGLKRRGVRHRR